MKKDRVLIVSDSPDRRAFLEFHLNQHDLVPVWYPNIMAAAKAVRLDSFAMVVVDLSLPIEPKLSLLKETYHFQPEAQLLTIGKEHYLKTIGILTAISSIVSITSIDLFPKKLERYWSREDKRHLNGT